MKEHIDTFNFLLSLSTHPLEERAAFRAAIDLMLAAEPKDEAAEREHCEHVAEAMNGFLQDERVPVLMREHAAVRAEGHMAGYLHSIHAQRATESALLPQVTELRAENEGLKRELELATAESEARRLALSSIVESTRDSDAELDELEAENERLTIQLATMRSKCRSAEELTARFAALETKLTNLQSAVAKVVDTFNHHDTHRQHEMRALRRAYEATK